MLYRKAQTRDPREGLASLHCCRLALKLCGTYIPATHGLVYVKPIRSTWQDLPPKGGRAKTTFRLMES